MPVELAGPAGGVWEEAILSRREKGAGEVYGQEDCEHRL